MARHLCVGLLPISASSEVLYLISVIGTIFGSFDREMSEISANIRHHWTEIDIAANFVNIAESRAIQEAEKTRRRGRPDLLIFVPC